jgi:hypothetical protein
LVIVLGRPSWLDMTAGDVLSFDERGAVQGRNAGSSVIALVRPRHVDGAVMGAERGFAL